MSALSIQVPFPVFQDRDGQPLDNGYVWLGTSSLNPQTNPVVAYYDSALTIVATQPLRTINGFISRAGSPAQVYVDAVNFSILVQDSKGTTVFSVPEGTGISPNASGVVYDPAGTGAVATTVQAKLREQVSVKDFGAVGDGATDDRAAIQLAINYASATGRAIYVPAGTYILTKGAVQTAESGVVYPCLTMASNMHIDAEPGAIFKLANSQSTDGAPLNVPMFFSNSVLENISFRGLTMDQNGVNNGINNVNYTFAHILFSGTPAGVVAGASNVSITNCTFRNTPGATCIGLGQSEALTGTISSNWIISGNLFANNGLDCGDHSSIYALADRVICTDNIFTADTMAYATGGQAAYEVHGADQIFSNNRVGNYYQGLYVATNKISEADNIIISDNVLSPVSDYGVTFYRESATETAINKVSILNNIIGLSDRATAAGFKAGISITSTYPVSNIIIEGNQCSKVGTNEASAFVLIALQGVAVATTHTGIKITGNAAYGLTHGVYMTTQVNGIGSVSITNNTFKNFAVAGVETQTRGIYLERLSGVAEVEEIIISGNNFIQDTGAMTYGVYLQSGVIVNLFMGPDNSYSGVTNNYVEGVTITNRRGYYPSKAYTPLVNIGGAVTIGNGTLDGSYVYGGGLVTAFVKYVVGSTDTIPGGNLNIGLPLASINAGQIYMGDWRIDDTSAGLNYFGTAVNDGTGQYAAFRVSGGSTATSGSPVTLAAGDVLNLQMVYKAGIS